MGISYALTAMCAMIGSMSEGGAMTLDGFFKDNSRVALAFSGGVDSAFLLYAASHAGADVRAYYVKTPFQPRFELEDAERLADELGASLKVLEADVLSSSEIAANPPDRCYLCKRIIMGTIREAAIADGYDLIIDGTNASDDLSDRPGVKALMELGVRSPLRECGITKDEIRRRSREAGLFTWDKSAYACLATRIPMGEPIDREKLEVTESAEDYLRGLGFIDFRVRMMGRYARIQVRESQLPLLMERRNDILNGLKGLYSGILLDLEVRDE